MSSAAILTLTAANNEKPTFSEEILNGFLALLSIRIEARQDLDFIFDTLMTSMIMANILNHQRVEEMFIKRNVSLD